MSARLAALAIADPPERWRALGFTVSGGDRVLLGGVTLQLGAPGRGVTGWTLAGAETEGDICGLATTVTAAQPPVAPGPGHDNGATGLDHLVILAPDYEGTVAAFAARGMPLRRESERDDRRQGFRRLGPAILEIVEASDLRGPPRFWGLVVVVADLDALHARLAPHLREPRPAVQPGRRIATLGSSAGLSTKLAFMDAE
jgi:hypothetical protein